MKYRVTILLFIITNAVNVTAQVPQFRFSQKSILKIEKAENAERKLKLSRRLYHRDSVRFNRELKRYYRYSSDSLSDALSKIKPALPSHAEDLSVDTVVVSMIDSSRKMAVADLDSGIVNRSMRGLSDFPTNTPLSIENVNANKHVADVKNELTEKIGEPYQGDLPELPSQDSLTQNLLSANYQRLVTNEYSVVGFPEIRNLSDTASLKEIAKRKAQDCAMKFLSDNPQLVNKIQNRMSRLMKKYSFVPNSNDLSTAVKRTSLQGQRFKERLFIAVNFQLPSFNPVVVDLSPAIGYRINARFIAGLGLNYRKAFSDSIPTLAKTMWGYKAFSSYDVVNQFFVYGEFNRNTIGVLQGAESNNNPSWTSAMLVGVGRKFRMHRKLESTVVALYNLMHQSNNPIYSSPWSVRVGFQSSALGFR